MQLNLKNDDILLGARIGIEFEFFSNYNIEKTVTELTRLLNKKITICAKAHSDFKPTADNYKIEPDMSGGAKLLELVTGSHPYQEARIILIKVFKWIKENGSTSDRCGIHLNISFDKDKYGDTFLSNLNTLKFILDFDEDFIYKMFPKRKSLVYAKSIKFIVPRDKYMFSTIGNINPYNFIYPTEKYYGVNFKKLVSNYLEFRYLGGENYERRTNDVLTLLDHFILQLYNSAIHKEFTASNLTELRKILNNYKHLTQAYKSFAEFKQFYPNVGLLVDLDSDARRIDTYWPKLRDLLFSLLNECNLKDGILNYNSDSSKLQIKDADLTDSFKIESVDIIECKVNGILTNCDVFESEISSAEIYNSNIFNNTKVTGSKLENCYVNNTCTLVDCYVYGKNSLMNGTMKGGIFREGRITNLSKFEDTERVEYEKLKTRVDVKH